MKIIPKLTGLLVLAFAGGTAQADTFNFSYLFGDGLTVTGSLNGTQDGIFVENVTNVSVSFGPDALPGTVFTSQFDGTSFSYLAGPIVSFDALQNNFVFANSDLAAGDFNYDSVFSILNAAVYADTVVASSTMGYASQDDPTVAGNWSLTRVSSSPVPDRGTTLALLAIGLVVLGWLRSRALSAASCPTATAR